MRFILTKDNYFSHVGSDPVENAVDFNSEWDMDTQPTQKHYWDGVTFILNPDRITNERRSKEELLAGLKAQVIELEEWLQSN